jgi:hypothetical protein
MLIVGAILIVQAIGLCLCDNVGSGVVELLLGVATVIAGIQRARRSKDPG